MRIFFIIVLLIPANLLAATPVWSKTGHRVVGEIASMHLSGRARRSISQLLDGQSLAYVSNFADEIKSDSRFDSYGPWHYVNYPLDKEYTEVTPSPNGDVILGIEKCIQVLEDKKSSREDRIFFLKMLVHFMGDLHQPLHVGREEDRGGNDIQVQWFGRGSNLHRVWDSEMINDYGMSYTELANSLPKLSRKERKAMQQGFIYEWVEESQEVASTIYQSADTGDKLGYSYSYQFWDTVEKQLHKGGLRLARVLNEIFS